MAREPRYRIDQHRDGYVVSLCGRGTMRESPAFQDFVARCLEGQKSVVVKLTECELLDSTFLGCLIGLHKQSLRYTETYFKLFADEQHRLHLLCTSGLHKLFDFAEELPRTSGQSLTLDFGHFDKQSLGRHVMHAHRLLAELGGDEAEKFRSIANRLREELRAESGGGAGA